MDRKSILLRLLEAFFLYTNETKENDIIKKNIIEKIVDSNVMLAVLFITAIYTKCC